MRSLLIALCLLFGVVTATPASASVGTVPTYNRYYDGNGHTYKVFVTVNAGTAHAKFRAYISCYDGNGYYGGWQTQPGPYLGSTAQCPSPWTAVAVGLQWG